MKSCPICGREYADDMSFCLEDGTPLASAAKTTEAVTEEYGGQTQVRPPAAAPTAEHNFPVRPAPSKSKAGAIAVIALLVVGLILIGGGMIGGFLYLRNLKKESARASGNSNDKLVFANNTFQNLNSNIYVANSANLHEPAATPTAAVPKLSPSKTADASNSNMRLTDVPPPPPTRALPKTISGGVLNGKAISLPRPPYPPAARAVRASGAVSVQVLIDEQGNVVSASAVSGHPLLQAAAVAAARGAKFSPTVLSGQPVKVSGVITYNFVP